MTQDTKEGKDSGNSDDTKGKDTGDEDVEGKKKNEEKMVATLEQTLEKDKPVEKLPEETIIQGEERGRNLG
jgi:hypothetical protein